jgi:transcriptional regulator with XRE-family HTH domain
VARSNPGRPPWRNPTYRQRYREFLKRLRKARNDAGLTQVDVARKLRRPQSFISKVESGARRVDVIELAEFARLYRKPMSYSTD